MNKSSLAILSVVVFLTAICLGGVVLAQNSQPNKPNTTVSGGFGVKVVPLLNQSTTSSSPTITSPTPGGSIPIYPYPIDNSLSQFISQLLTNTGDGTYTNLGVSTVAGVTTITADEIKVTSPTFTVHLVSLKAVIENQPYRSSPAQLTVTASLIEYKDSQTTFTGKDISFSQPLYTYYPYPVAGGSSGSGSGGVIPPTGK